MFITDFDVAIVEGDSHLSKWIVEQRRLDVQAEYCRLFQKYIPVGGVVVDVGACLGDHTLSYAQMVGRTGFVYAFEPNPEAFQCLRHNMRNFPQVKLIEAALGAIDTLGNMTPSIVEPDNLGAMAFHADEQKGMVAMNTLDGYEPLRIDFIKIDVEGAETEVLIGARETIKRCRPVMLIELNRPVMERAGVPVEGLLTTIRTLGYAIHPSEPHHSLDQPELDLLALPI